MNKFKITTLAISAFLVSSVFASTELSKEQISGISDKYPKIFNQPNIKILKGVSHGKFNEVELMVSTRQGEQKFSVYTSDKLNDVVFFGKAFNKDQVPYEIPADIESVKNGVLMTMGTGDKQIYLVTDPECPYCQKLDHNIKPETLKKYTINIISYPLPFHKNAKSMMYWVLSADSNESKIDRLHKVMNGDQEYKNFKPTSEQKAELDKQLDKSMAAVKELNVSGTPTILDEKLKPVHFSKLGSME